MTQAPPRRTRHPDNAGSPPRPRARPSTLFRERHEHRAAPRERPLTFGLRRAMAAWYAPPRTVPSVAITAMRPLARCPACRRRPGLQHAEHRHRRELDSERIQRYRRRGIAGDDEAFDIVLPEQPCRLQGNTGESNPGSWCRKAAAPCRRDRRSLRAAAVATARAER